MERAFQDYVANIVAELHSAVRVEFLPPRDPHYDDPIYPIRFTADTGDLIVGFPHRMVRIPEGKAEIYETVGRVVRLLEYFKKDPQADLTRGVDTSSGED